MPTLTYRYLGPEAEQLVGNVVADHRVVSVRHRGPVYPGEGGTSPKADPGSVGYVATLVEVVYWPRVAK